MRKYFIYVSLLVLTFSLIEPAFAQRGGGRSGSRGSVSVRGYTKRNGTYVAPHHRSSPNGSVYDNWSTKGNVNPYTGKEGTKTNTPLYSSKPIDTNVSPYSSKPADTNINDNKSLYDNNSSYTPIPNSTPNNNLPSSANEVTPKTSDNNNSLQPSNSLADLSSWDTENRVKQAERLKRFGLNVDWKQHSYLEMSDWENRITQAERLKRFGLNIDWKQHNYLEMSDWENRITQAERLKRFGLNVDWKQHNYLEMSDWENRITQAERLKRLGVDVDWRQYNYFQLCALETQIKQSKK